MMFNEYETLSNYAALEGCELGDYVGALLNLYDSYSEPHGMNIAFKQAILKELGAQLAWFQENYEVVVKFKTVPKHKTGITELVWIGDE